MSKVSTKEIRIIGPRRSGKTTYLAALLRLPAELKNRFQGLQITPLTEDGESLIGQARDMIETGAKLVPTDIGNEPEYHFSIHLPVVKNRAGLKLELLAKDYSGEIFEWAGDNRHESELKVYLDDWFSSEGLMIMMTDWQAEKDYAPAIQRILSEWSDRTKVNSALKSMRIAIVMTKCERGEIWPCRIDPEEDLFRVRLPKTYALLKKLPEKSRHFFACSTFGVMNDMPGEKDPRPNRYVPNDGSSAEFNAYLKDKNAWKPYGLISPIYWLTTGTIFNDECL
jgi:Double-GTPase 1